MTFQELKHALGIQEDQLHSTKVEIDKSTLTPNIDRLIDYSFLGYGPDIDQAVLVSLNESEQTLQISGVGDFLDMPNLPVTFNAQLDADGQAQITLIYEVIGVTPDPVFWTLSRSIPGVPVHDPNQYTTHDRSTGEVFPPYWHPLDKLPFFDTNFIVTSQPGASDPFLGHPLEWGTNFSSKVKAEGPMALINGLMGQSNDLDVTGTIRRPMHGETTNILTTPYSNLPNEVLFPWDVKGDFAEGLPGVHLKVHLDIDYSLVKDSLEFKADHLHIYTPYNSQWDLPQTNPAFTPQQAFTGTLSIPDSEISMDFAVPFDWEAGMLSFVSRFEGLSLSALGDLAGLTGTGESLLAKLPAPLQDLSEGLGALELLNLTLDLDFRNLSTISIPRLTFAVGMPDLNWEIWPDHFEVNAIKTFFDFQFPFRNPAATGGDQDFPRQLNVRVEGQMEVEGKEFRVGASSTNGFDLYAAMESGETIPLSQIINSFGDQVEVPSGLVIDQLRLGVSPGHAYSFAMGLASGENAWELDLGGQNFMVRDAFLHLEKVKNQSASAAVGGELVLSDLGSLSMAYNSPGSIVMHSYLEEVDLVDLAETLLAGAVELPNGLSFVLKENSVLIEKHGQDYKFMLATEVEEFGSLAFQLDKVNGQWGLAIGLDLSTSKLSELPGLSSLSVLEDHGVPSDLLLVISSLKRPDFRFPGLAQFENPKLNSNSIPVPKSGGLGAGLNLHGKWIFDSSDQGTNTLLNLLGLTGGLDVSISIPRDPQNGTRLYTRYAGQLLDKYPLDVQLGLQLYNNSPELFLGGTLQVPIQGENCLFDVALSVLHTGIYFSGSMQGTVDFEDFKLSNLGLMFGYNWGLVPSFGLMGSIDTSDFHASIALLFDSGNPAKSVMAGAISDITLEGLAKDIAKADAVPDELIDVLASISLEGINAFEVDPSLIAALDSKDHASVAAAFNAAGGLNLPSNSENLLVVVNAPGEKWSLTDVNDNMKHYEVELEGGTLQCKANAQIYLAPQGIALGGFTFNQGFRVMGALSVLGLNWTTDIDIAKRKGIAATSYLDDNLIIWNRDFFNLSDASDSQGPRFSMATYNRSTHPEPDFRKPHFILDGKLSVMGGEAMARVQFGTSKFSFEASATETMQVRAIAFSGDYGVNWAVEGEISKGAGIQFGGEYNFDLSGKVELRKLLGAGFNMGKVQFDLQIGVELQAGFDGSSGSIGANGQINLFGTNHSFGFNLNGQTEGIGKLGDKVMDEFLEVVKSFYDTGEKWVNAVGDTIEDLGDEVAAAAEVLSGHFGKSATEVGNFLKNMGADANRIASELVANGLATTEEALATTLKALDFSAGEVANGLKTALNSSAQAVTNALKAVGYNATQIGPAIRDTFEQGIDALADLFKAAGFADYGIAWMMKVSFPNASHQLVLGILKRLGFDSTVIGRLFKNVYQQSVQAIASLLKAAGFNTSGIAWMARNVFAVSDADLLSLLNYMGFNTTQIGWALKNAYQKGMQAIGELLKAAGFSATGIAWMAKHVFSGQGLQQVAELLSSLGFNSTDIGRAFRTTFNQTAEAVATLLNNIGCSVSGIVWAIKHAFSEVSLQDTATILKNLGHDALAIGGAVVDVFNKAAREIAELLHGIGFGRVNLGNVIQSLFPGTTAQAVAQIFKDLGMAASDIAKSLVKQFGKTSGEVSKVLKDIGFQASDIGRALQEGLGHTTGEVASLLKDTGMGAAKIGVVLRDVFNSTAGNIALKLKSLGFNEVNISRMFKSAFPDISYQSIGNILTSLFSVDSVVNALKNQFSRGAQEICDILRKKGVSARAIGESMNRVMGKTSEEVVKLLQDVGFAAEDAAELLYKYFKIDSTNAGKYMVRAGYEAGEIASMLRKDAFWDKGADATGKILKKAGLGKSTVKSAMRSAGWAKKTVNDILDSIF